MHRQEHRAVPTKALDERIDKRVRRRRQHPASGMTPSQKPGAVRRVASRRVASRLERWTWSNLKEKLKYVHRNWLSTAKTLLHRFQDR
jgi:hypothetical protein